jgi:glycine/serine hydroxymethyltransferase
MREPEMLRIAEWIDRVAAAPDDAAVLERVRSEVLELTDQFPLYPSAFQGGEMRN